MTKDRPTKRAARGRRRPLSPPHPPRLIWLVGGGTAGHIIPLLAVAEELAKDKTISLVYIGADRSLEEKLARGARLSFQAIPTGKLRRYLSAGAVFFNLRDAWRLTLGIAASYRLIRRHGPDLIFSKGGPVALPVAVAAWLVGTPLLTHESDAVMGYTNRFMARFAKRVLTAFPASVYPPPLARRITAVGIPLRRQFCQGYKLTPRPFPTVLITGGSQGAQALNEAVAAILPRLLTLAAVVHICGEPSYEGLQALGRALPPPLAKRYTLFPFTPEMAKYMAQATVVVSRASSAAFEIASLGKPMILIPLPGAANDHQMRNAEIFVSHNAAMILRQEQLTPEVLYERIEKILLDRELRAQLAAGTRNFASCGATKAVVRIIKELLGR